MGGGCENYYVISRLIQPSRCISLHLLSLLMRSGQIMGDGCRISRVRVALGKWIVSLSGGCAKSGYSWVRLFSWSFSCASSFSAELSINKALFSPPGEEIHPPPGCFTRYLGISRIIWHSNMSLLHTIDSRTHGHAVDP